jgi:hypothetical protein
MTKKNLVRLVVALVVVVAAAIALVLNNNSGSSSNGGRGVTADQANAIQLDDARSSVAAKLGGEGKKGSLSAPAANGNVSVFFDCWHYSATGLSKKEFVVCFVGDSVNAISNPFKQST